MIHSLTRPSSPAHLVLGLTLGMALCGWNGVSASFVDGPTIDDSPSHCARPTWTWLLETDATQGKNLCDEYWIIKPSSPSIPASSTKPYSKYLDFTFQHLDGPHETDTPKNPNDPITIRAGAFKQESTEKTAGAFHIVHPQDHHDVYRWTVQPYYSDFKIWADAQHNPTPLGPMRWSYRNLIGEVVVESVTASFGKDKDGNQIPPRGVPKKDLPIGKVSTAGGKLPKGSSVNQSDKTEYDATDYTVKAVKGDPVFSETTMAFVVGQPGSLYHADLAAMTEAFVGAGEFFVPMIFDANELVDLYVAVDLVQWLSFPIPIADGQLFDFIDGVNPDLAGIQIATSPFSFDPVYGYVSDNLATLTGEVFGRVDGHTVAEPAIPLMLAFGVLWIAARRRPALGVE